jgi:signal transduction histidine kinase
MRVLHSSFERRDTYAVAMDGFAGTRQLRRLLDAVLSVGAELDLATVLQRIVEAATDLVDARYGALGVLDERHESLAQFLTVGLDLDQRSAIGSLPTGHGILGVLITDPRPLRLPDLTRHPDSAGFPPNHPPMSSFLGVPVMVHGQVFGNLYLCDKIGGEPFSETDEELCVALATAAGVAIDNARLHSRVANLVLFEERDRIARDLHDTVIQRLFAIGLNLQGVASMSLSHDMRDRLEGAVDDLDTTVREIRSAIFELHSTRVAEASLRRSATDLVAESARSLGFEPSIRFEGPLDQIEPTLAEHLLAVQREALSNVARHAHASAAEVAITLCDGWLRLVVTDDGIGPGEGSGGGRGMVNMKERARSLGGDVDLSARDDGGSVLTWQVPT